MYPSEELIDLVNSSEKSMRSLENGFLGASNYILNTLARNYHEKKQGLAKVMKHGELDHDEIIGLSKNKTQDEDAKFRKEIKDFFPKESRLDLSNWNAFINDGSTISINGHRLFSFYESILEKVKEKVGTNVSNMFIDDYEIGDININNNN